MFSFVRYKKVQRAQEARDHQTTVRLLNKLLLRQPQNVVFLKDLANAYFKQDKFADTLVVLEQVEKIEPLGPHTTQLQLRAIVKEARRSGDFEQVATALETLIEQKPNDVSLCKELANVRFKLGDAAGVIAILNQVIKIEPLGPHSKTLFQKAEEMLLASVREEAAALRKAGDLQGARSALKAYMAQFGETIDLLKYLAMITFQDEDNEETIALLERAAVLAPLGRDARLVKGRAYLRLGQNAQARELLRVLADEKDATAAVFFHLVQACDRLQLRDEAEATLERLRDEAPEEPKKWILLSNGYTDLRQYNKALEVFEYCAAEGFLNVDQRVAHGRAALRAGQFQRAAEILSGDFSGEKSTSTRLFYLFEAHKKGGNIDAAEATALRIQDMAPTNMDDWYKLGRIQRDIGNSKAAADCFRAAGEKGLAPDLVTLELAECDLKSGVLNRAEETLRALFEANPDNSRINFVYARVLARQGRFEQAKTHFETVIRLSPRQSSAYRELAMICTHAAQVEDAEKLLRTALELEPNSGSVNAELAAICLEKGQYAETRKLAEHALEVEPDNANAKMILANLEIFDTAYGKPLSLSICGPVAQSMEAAADTGWDALADAVEPLVLDNAQDLRAAIPGARNTWIVWDDDQFGPDERGAICNRLRGSSGAVLCSGHGAARKIVALSSAFARDALEAFDDAGLADEGELSTFLLERGREIYPRLGAEQAEVLAPLEGLRGEIFLISSSGHNLFGGAEHFLRGMALFYRSLGFSPVLVGHRGEFQQEGVTPDGLPFVQFCDKDEASFRSFLLQRRPALLHVVTGSGPFVLNTAYDIDVPIVYGTHFWREMLRGSGWFPDIDRTASPKLDFKSLLLRYEAVYANSAYTLDMQYEHHKLTTDLLYSLPSTTTEPAQREGRDIVLLVNARPEKGFDLLLQVAALCPGHKFVAIASQSGQEEAQIAVDRAGVSNVEIIAQVADMEPLYRRAWCVMVPSYRFVETFSRVVIEAHRFGVPVIGSDRGNVPLLLEQSGVALPEEAAPWAAELTRLHDDPAYWARRAQLATENSDRYAFSDQKPVHERLVRQALRPVLVAVGNGIGNIIQCTPAIRRLSEHLGQPVDIVINQDFPGCEWLFKGSPYVGMVYGSDTEYMRRQYDLVLVLASFGKAVPQFHAKRLFVARHKIPFESTEQIHESKYNLDCFAAAEIGLDYQDEDIAKYFVGDFQPTGLESRRIVLHAGGKPGEWEVKRWPYFEGLAKELMERGWEVISTGMPHEHVPGTVDRTGTPLVETLKTISDAAYCIANDSGLMHVADGVGVPVTALFGPTSVLKNGPLSPDCQVITPQNDCCPCQFTDRFKTCTGMYDIPLEEVRDKVLQHLDRLAQRRSPVQMSAK